MTNENCLKDTRCPQCGQTDRFFIIGVAQFEVTDDGSEAIGDHEWDDTSATRCPNCGRSGSLRDFRIKSKRRHDARTLALTLSSSEAIRAACELSLSLGEQQAQVMYRSDHLEDDDYVGADLVEFSQVKDDPEEFTEFCGGGRNCWQLWLSEPCETPETSSQELGHHRLPPDLDDMNDSRAEWAGYALAAFTSQTGADDESAVADLLCDLMHLADRSGTNFNADLERARMHYTCETSLDPNECFDSNPTERNPA